MIEKRAIRSGRANICGNVNFARGEENKLRRNCVYKTSGPKKIKSENNVRARTLPRFPSISELSYECALMEIPWHCRYFTYLTAGDYRKMISIFRRTRARKKKLKYVHINFCGWAKFFFLSERIFLEALFNFYWSISQSRSSFSWWRIKEFALSFTINDLKLKIFPSFLIWEHLMSSDFCLFPRSVCWADYAGCKFE